MVCYSDVTVYITFVPTKSRYTFNLIKQGCALTVTTFIVCISKYLYENSNDIVQNLHFSANVLFNTAMG